MVKRVLFLVTLIFSVPAASFGQCAMCRATIENNVSVAAEDIAAGLNLGILYLLMMPYLSIFLVGLLWYYTSKKETYAKNKMAGYLRRKLSALQKR